MTIIITILVLLAIIPALIILPFLLVALPFLALGYLLTVGLVWILVIILSAFGIVVPFSVWTIALIIYLIKLIF